MKKVLLRGPFLTLSGYGVHSRQIAKWALERQDFDVTIQATPWGVTSWIINDELEDGLIGDIMSKTAPAGRPNVGYDLSFQVQLPNEWDPTLAAVNIGVTAAVETDRCNPQWVDACNRMSAIIVPSTFTKKTIKDSGELNVPIYVVPEAFYDEVLDDGIEPLDHEFSTSFNFLVFGQMTGNNPENDRKNLYYTLKWLCEEFKDRDDVGVILKTNSGRATKIDRLLTEKFAKNVVDRVRVGNSPKVHVLHGKMTNEEMVSLYRHPSVKALVSLTRGEGYGLPLLEAASCNLPVIATNWSGHRDFLGHGKTTKVNYHLEPVHQTRIDGNIFIPGARWAQPSESDAKRKLRKFYNSHEEPQAWANDLGEKLREKYKFSDISDILDKTLKKVLK